MPEKPEKKVEFTPPTLIGEIQTEKDGPIRKFAFTFPKSGIGMVVQIQGEEPYIFRTVDLVKYALKSINDRKKASEQAQSGSIEPPKGDDNCINSGIAG